MDRKRYMIHFRRFSPDDWPRAQGEIEPIKKSHVCGRKGNKKKLAQIDEDWVDLCVCCNCGEIIEPEAPPFPQKSP